MSPAPAWALSFAVTVALIVISYEWLDQPIAFLVHAELHGVPVFPTLTYIPGYLTSLCGLACVVVGIRRLTGQPLSRLEAVILLSGISLGVSVSIKEQLKHVFGRTWPETWINYNPSLIDTGAYGFNPFHGGQGYASFPSGHTAVICALMSIYWICYPQLRPLCAGLIAVVVIGLIGADYHFLSDIIAGGFLGSSIGWMTVLFWQAGGDRLIHAGKTGPCDHVPTASHQ